MDLEVFAWFALAAIALFCTGVCMGEREGKKRKPNIRLPRRTAWDRFRQYQDRQH